MAKQERRYWAFMLRLWQVGSGRAIAWRASLEDPHTGERKGFADLDSLLAFLKDQIEPGTDSSSPLERGRSNSG